MTTCLPPDDRLIATLMTTCLPPGDRLVTTCLPPCSPPDAQDKLGQKVEIEKLLLKDKAIMAEFHGAVGDNSQFYDVRYARDTPEICARCARDAREISPSATTRSSTT